MSAEGVKSQALFGREAERAILSGLLDGARSLTSGVLVIRGEPGIGKSALLEDVVMQAEEMRVVRTTGVEAESELAFATLHQLTRPLLGLLREIPGPQTAALSSALGRAPSAKHDHFLIGAAVLSLLATAAEERPLVCVVDDAHWLDKPSADALTFAARRLQAEPILLLFAARDGEARTFKGSGLPEMRLEGIGPDAADALLAQIDPNLAPDVRERLVMNANGNPLALIELPKALDEARAAGHEASRPLPLTSRVQDAFLERARQLPEPTQELLLLAAADDTGDPEIIVRGADLLGIDVRALDQAESAGLLKLEETVAFRHPLVRSAIYQGASFGRRQSMHWALVKALEGEQYRDRRAWHRAAATLGTDDDVARELEETAERAGRRSGHGAAADALERAAALSTDEDVRARRLADAGEEAWLASQPARATSLLERARPMASDPTMRAEIANLRGWIELQLGSAAEAHEILFAAARDIAPIDPRKAAQMLHDAGEAAALSGDNQGELAAGRLARSLRGARTRDQFEVLLLSGIASMLEGDAANGALKLRCAIEVAEESDAPRRFSGAATASAYLGDMAAACRFWSRGVAEAREKGAITSLAYALAMLAPAEMWNRRVASARVNASEGLRLATETGQTNAACYQLAVLARVAAFYGNEEECRARAAEALEMAALNGLGLQAGMATWALGDLELAQARHAEAFSHFEIVAAGEPGMSHPALRWLVTPDLVEAGIRAGQSERARVASDDLEAWAMESRSPITLPLVARCRGLFSEGAEAKGHFEDALRLHAQAEQPFERARTELVYGAALRRGRQRRKARRHLRAALDAFEQLGARLWAERARSELRASGETARRRDPSTIDQLTPQELQIARFVAQGSTNKEVAAQLFLSPRTIDFHMRNIFSKLEISKRQELARLGLHENGDPFQAEAAFRSA